ncbi:MAG: hypothetical protein KDE20_24145 [Caldilineaceae bacterium]|nr:hypothetical protein [Caldilineaceae bacterium]
MNLKLKRLVRTQSSEQYALFDLNQLDDQDAPMTIGKLDLHYTGEGIYGTLLLWDDLSRALRAGQRSAFIRALLDEVAQPMGVPNEYVIEFFAPGLDDYEVFHNVTIDDAGDELYGDDDEDYAADGDDDTSWDDDDDAG